MLRACCGDGAGGGAARGGGLKLVGRGTWSAGRGVGRLGRVGAGGRGCGGRILSTPASVLSSMPLSKSSWQTYFARFRRSWCSYQYWVPQWWRAERYGLHPSK